MLKLSFEGNCWSLGLLARLLGIDCQPGRGCRGLLKLIDALRETDGDAIQAIGFSDAVEDFGGGPGTRWSMKRFLVSFNKHDKHAL